MNVGSIQIHRLTVLFAIPSHTTTDAACRRGSDVLMNSMSISIGPYLFVGPTNITAILIVMPFQSRKTIDF